MPGYLAQHLKVCATPEPGFWMANGSAEALWDLTGAWQDRAESPTFHGPPPSLTEWPLSGYAADSLFYIMTKMSEFTTYEVKFYATYTQALYATATSHECDVGCVCRLRPLTPDHARTHAHIHARIHMCTQVRTIH